MRAVTLTVPTFQRSRHPTAHVLPMSLNETTANSSAREIIQHPIIGVGGNPPESRFPETAERGLN